MYFQKNIYYNKKIIFNFQIQYDILIKMKNFKYLFSYICQYFTLNCQFLIFLNEKIKQKKLKKKNKQMLATLIF